MDGLLPFRFGESRLNRQHQLLPKPLEQLHVLTHPLTPSFVFKCPNSSKTEKMWKKWKNVGQKSRFLRNKNIPMTILSGQNNYQFSWIWQCEINICRASSLSILAKGGQSTKKENFVD